MGINRTSVDYSSLEYRYVLHENSNKFEVSRDSPTNGFVLVKGNPKKWTPISIKTIKLYVVYNGERRLMIRSMDNQLYVNSKQIINTELSNAFNNLIAGIGGDINELMDNFVDIYVNSL